MATTSYGNMLNTSNPRAYFDITINNIHKGRVVFELYSNITPKTANNFLTLCNSSHGIGKYSKKELTYKNSIFHRVIKGFMIQGGDFENMNGTGGESIYGHKFEDENFEKKHDSAGLLSMANVIFFFFLLLII